MWIAERQVRWREKQKERWWEGGREEREERDGGKGGKVGRKGRRERERVEQLPLHQTPDRTF